MKREGSAEAAPAKRIKTTHFSTDLHPAQGRLAEYAAATGDALTEKDVAIECYVDETVPPIAGILKHRFLDFLVNEVTKDGTVIRLTDIAKPIEVEEEKPAVEQQVEKPKPAQTWPEDAEARLEGLLTVERIGDLKALFKKGPPATQAKPKSRQNKAASGDSVLSEALESKEARTTLHKAIRELFGGLFLSEIVNEDGKSRVAIMWAANNQHRDRKVSRPSSTSHHKFMHFHLQKTNRETHDVLGVLAKVFNCPVRDLSTTGTKDKRSVSVQRVALRRGQRTLEEVWRLINFGPSTQNSSRGRGRGRGGRGGHYDVGRAQLRGICSGDFAYRPCGFELGDLGGNRFDIVLRDVKAGAEDAIDRAISTLRDRGFINYFGMQRFGSGSIGTHVVGLAIMQGNFALASDLILRPRSTDSPDIAVARQLWARTRDARATLQIMPRNCVAERCLLEHYAKDPGIGHANAFAIIPKNLRMMYIHAYQSRLWNVVASERIGRYGCDKPVIGDLVLASSATNGDVETIEEVDEAISTELSNGAPRTELTGQAAMIDEIRRTSKLPDVKTLETEEDVARHTVFDVVLPLAGFIVTYPSGALGQLYRDNLMADGLDPDHLYRSPKEYSMGGVYRKLMHRPRDVTHEVLYYDDPDFELAQTDEDRLKGRKLPLPPVEGRYTALKVAFTLSSSTYATMALREILKTDTAASSQKVLTEAMNAEHARVVEDK